MVSIRNKYLRVQISEVGAEIKSIACEGEEYIWNSNPDVWGRSGPVLFPVCGAIRDNEYVIYGEKYTMSEKHGFAKLSTFSIEKHSMSAITLLLRSNEETLSMYPFDFELRVTFTVSGRSVLVNYNVKNTSANTMYFSIGSHEGYACSNGVEDYDLIFPWREDLETVLHQNGIYGSDKKTLAYSSCNLPLYNRYFEDDALVFENLHSRSVILRNRINGKSVKVDFPGCETLVVWTKPGAEFLCIEPWAGYPDCEDNDENLSSRKGIRALNSNKTFSITHKITVMRQ